MIPQSFTSMIMEFYGPSYDIRWAIRGLNHGIIKSIHSHVNRNKTHEKNGFHSTDRYLVDSSLVSISRISIVSINNRSLIIIHIAE